MTISGKVIDIENKRQNGNNNYIQVSSGDLHSLYLKKDGTMEA